MSTPVEERQSVPGLECVRSIPQIARCQADVPELVRLQLSEHAECTVLPPKSEQRRDEPPWARHCLGQRFFRYPIPIHDRHANLRLIPCRWERVRPDFTWHASSIIVVLFLIIRVERRTLIV